ncbi:MAG: DUF2461 domain-containing protein [Prolixibacteraceae bacterium]
MKEIYDFLLNLEKNNNREWFDENRETYQKTKQQFLHITEILINEIRSFDSTMPFQDPKKCVFRIFRDVRFSNDKRPYKSNFGTFIARDGRKGGSPGYYFHIQPGASFLGGGIYMPEANKLKAIRTEIVEHTADFLELVEDPDFTSKFNFFSDDKLKTAPKGFSKDFEHIDWLRYKSYAASRSVSDEELFSPDLIDKIVEDYRNLAPLNQFLNNAIDQENS